MDFIETAKNKLVKEGWVSINTKGLNSSFFEIAQCFGQPITQKGRPVIQNLVPKNQNESIKGSASSIVGKGVFPWHSDTAHWNLPARYLAFIGLKNEPNIPTLLMDSYDLYDTLTELSEWKLGVWKMTRVQNSFLCGITFSVGNQSGFRWDSLTMKPYNDVANKIQTILLNRIEERVSKAKKMFWNNPNEIVIVDNWRMLHSRPLIPENSGERLLQRILLKGYE